MHEDISNIFFYTCAHNKKYNLKHLAHVVAVNYDAVLLFQCHSTLLYPYLNVLHHLKKTKKKKKKKSEKMFNYSRTF